MSSVFVRGGLFNHSGLDGLDGLDGLAQGCNCAGAMGKGIAAQRVAVDAPRPEEAA